MCNCGANISQTGGDPDWGECFNCKSSRHQEQDYDRYIEDCLSGMEHDYYCDMCRSYGHGGDMLSDGSCYCGAVQLSRSGWPPTEGEIAGDTGE